MSVHYSIHATPADISDEERGRIYIYIDFLVEEEKIYNGAYTGRALRLNK